MQGYIKLYRGILDNPIVCKDAEYFSIWCYLLLNATHKEYDSMFNNQRITLKKGQLITGRKSLSEKFNISQSKVQRVLKRLEIEQQIEQQTCSQNRLISVLNWEQYQESEQPSEQQVNNKWTTSEQQVNTNKNVKNVKNDKKYILYSEFVKLTEEEYQKLIEKLGETKTKDYIERLNNYIGSKGKKYKSHYHTILSWSRKDGDNGNKKSVENEYAGIELKF